MNLPPLSYLIEPSETNELCPYLLQVTVLTKAVTYKSFEEGAFIYREHDPVSCFYVIADGKVEMSRVDPDRYILSVWPPIGHTQGIFSVSGLLLVTRRAYSQCLVSYWSHAGHILSVWSPIGHTQGIFSVFGLLLVTRREHSQCLLSCWSHAGGGRTSSSPSIWRGTPIGHTQGIFSVSGLLLVTRRAYSQCLVSYWSLHQGGAEHRHRRVSSGGLLRRKRALEGTEGPPKYARCGEEQRRVQPLSGIGFLAGYYLGIKTVTRVGRDVSGDTRNPKP
jgi:hypothetical protein